MPTYGYQCTQCDHQFQVFQRITDEPVGACPKCGAPVKRIMYPVGIVFKGSGWYITDSRKPEPAGANGADKGTDGAASADKKPAAEAPSTDTSAAKKEPAPE